MKVLQLSRLPDFYTRYDVEVPETKCFVAGGVVVHNTSAHISYKAGRMSLFAGGAKHETFVKLFNEQELIEKFKALGHDEETSIAVYGEAYGGKQQGMRDTYGDSLRFVVFEVKIDGTWLAVPNAESIAKKMGLEFMPYKEIEATLSAIDAERDADSEIAIRRGMGSGKMREGIVLRPLEEVRFSNGDRAMAKHKRDEFRESRSKQPRPDGTARKAVMLEAQAYVDEYIVHQRLLHVLDALGGHGIGIERTADVIKAMIEDVLREEPPAETLDLKAVRKAAGRATAILFKRHLKFQLEERQASDETE